jgi:hypothetical protein
MHSGDGAASSLLPEGSRPTARPGDYSHTPTDKVVVFEDLFLTGLRMPSHPMLADILQKVLHSIAPVDTECYCSDQEVYLGGRLLRKSLDC